MTEVSFTRVLSGSTDGRGIAVAATSTPGTTIHTASSGINSADQLYLYAVNSDTVDRDLTIEFGGTTDPDDLITITITKDVVPVEVIPGFLLRNGLVVKAFASAASVIMVHGYIKKFPINPNTSSIT
tara:strand:+ start:1534 stop:1914 length:381 start_codon:yes stop_codon:yes gene_type:complete